MGRGRMQKKEFDCDQPWVLSWRLALVCATEFFFFLRRQNGGAPQGGEKFATDREGGRGGSGSVLALEIRSYVIGHPIHLG
jgi:hypothetical protein